MIALIRPAIEGMVCKRKDSVYAYSRSKHWLKIKTPAGREEMRKRIENW
jgi:ATP-dependent DNA ligase